MHCSTIIINRPHNDYQWFCKICFSHNIKPFDETPSLTVDFLGLKLEKILLILTDTTKMKEMIICMSWEARYWDWFSFDLGHLKHFIKKLVRPYIKQVCYFRRFFDLFHIYVELNVFQMISMCLYLALSYFYVWLSKPSHLG